MTSIDSFTEPAWSDRGHRAATRVLPRSLRRAFRSLAKLAGLIILVGIGLVVATLLVSERPQLAQAPQPPSDAWLEVRRPLPVYALTGTDFAKLPLDYEAFRNDAGGGRRDILTFGDPRGDKEWLQLSLYRVGTEAAAVGGGIDDVARLAQDAGRTLSSRAAPTSLSTRFGRFEAVDIRMAAASGPTGCLGFRSPSAGDATLRIAGLACGTAERPVGRDLVSCVIDRIDLLSAGDDQSLRDIFVAAERRRGSACMPSSLTPGGTRTTWLDANTSPPVLKASSLPPARAW